MKTLDEAERQAREIVNAWAATAVAFSWVPGSTIVLGAADWEMISDVATAFEVRSYSSEAVLGVIGGCLMGLTLSEVFSFIPVLGWAIKAAIAGSVTKALGEAVIAYFRGQSPLRQAHLGSN